ncbi:papilin isoform X2 [Cylas formicarius]|uniref:papilin isoform X2 n=1 Tax=Cylas formicarius TaxID=197179 RepID=UPI00295846BF|nr:papilin isoform X2 [Cylas formicarius]
MELLFGARRYLSSAILVLVFITFFHTVLSKHKIRHYKDRFKRQQGAHLYLPESYVTEGGEGPDQGPWSDWSEPSPCSRTCGGGVSTQYRQCQPGYNCQGPDRRHFSCNTQDCPDTGDFRAQQCSEYDEVPFENVTYQWVPYTKGPNPCELNCMPRGQRFYYRHAPVVIDGTRCDDQTLDVCVNGKCQPVGCDMMLGSKLKEDECRVCGGDGSTCNTVTDTLELNDMQVGYNDILLVPGGATNVLVEEIAPSNNYLAVRNTSGHYYLNGNWRIDFPRTVDFAGSKWTYERYPQGFAAPDKIYTLGPIDEPLFIVLLFQESSVPVTFKYSMPTNIQPGSESETYAWTFDEFTPCSATCGGGIQYRNVSCAGRKTLQPVDDKLCDENRKPVTSRKCNEIACQAQWVPHPWGNCSSPCGEGGTQNREISCQQIVSNGYPTLVDESQCQGPKPPQQQKCNEGKTCAKWHTGPWKPCDHLCGDGKQTRKVRCFIKDEENQIEILNDAQCEAIEPKPEEEKSCNVRPCEGVDWIASAWSGCDAVCGLTNETRKIFCATASGQIYANELCEETSKPDTVRKCESSNASCQYLWYVSQWSECSAKCGQGIQSRTSFCGLATKEGVKRVENDKCDQSNKFETLRNCTGTEECDGEWFSGPFGECSKPCGGGEKSRKVVCIKGNEVVDISHCAPEDIIFGNEDCNSQPCSDDAVIPTDLTKPNVETTKEQEKPTTSAAESTETSTELTLSDLWSDTPQDAETSESQTDIASITKNFEITPEPPLEQQPKETDDDYEIVPAEECDDGEWIDVAVLQVEKETTPYLSTSPDISETSFSLDDLMLSDGTTIGDESVFTGSGDSESSLKTTLSIVTTEEEGSGSEAFSIVTDASSSVSYITSEKELTTAETPQSSDVETSTVISQSSTEELSTVESSSGTESSFASDGSSSLSTLTSDGISKGTTSTETVETDTAPSSTSTESTESSDTSTSETSVPTETITTEIPSETTETGSSYSSESTESTSTVEMTSTSSTEYSTTESSTFTAENIGEADDLPTPNPRMIAEDETTPSTASTDVTSTTEEVIVTQSTSTTEESYDQSTLPETETFFASTSTESEFSSTTEFPGSTDATPTGGSSVSTELSSEFSTETTESTSETDIFYSTTETAEEGSTWATTHVTELFRKKRRMCKRRKIMQCKKTKYGCCWDNITSAKGPFDKGCPSPKTCKESKFGCCDDGVSAALGPKRRGCPSSRCDETLFGCCWDNKTQAEGNDNEGCPPEPPACSKSEWGCCKDNATEAKGPKQQGCEKERGTESPEIFTTTAAADCSISTYGCCPDGTDAEGPNYQGCDIPCSNSTYGCCPDKESPAHGPNAEGCCLSGPFGCCPDDITPATGANNEGCQCQYSPYGCCPDQTTSAKGYNNAGCGCKYTEYGCCPDDFTEASGPDYEGCLCHTYQFGCCPDGVSIAQGPHQQGCDCRTSEFGCCSDEKTKASGPNMAGCGCETTKYGCCLDGVAEAKGDNFEGCVEIPIDHQDSCSLPKERGPCRNYTVKWFFDMSYGGCSRFWYGGCEGNDNRFKSKEECDQTCVSPQGPDRCNLPKVAGSCEGYFPQWYYDKSSRQCTQFIYGGCLGNNNKFDTREECTEICVKDDSVDPCEQGKEEGPCQGQYRRYFYDKTSGECTEFTYGGCKGNRNNFATIEACKQSCAAPGVKRAKDTCHLPADIGECGNYVERWYFDTKDKRCRQFYYGGCGGNGNNFQAREECEQSCETPSQQPEQAPTQPARPTAQPTAPYITSLAVTIEQICSMPPDQGPCTENMTERSYYDRTYGVCKNFTYGGCGGNYNNFASSDECLQYCGYSQDICSLPPVAGPCAGEYAQFYYDPASDSCREFTFGGCEGNFNRFNDIASCEQQCRKTHWPVAEPIRTDAPPQALPSDVAMCYETVSPGNCSMEYPAFYYDPSTGKCSSFVYTGCHGNENRFSSEEQCERQCGVFRGQDVCNMEQDSGPCRGYFVKYYYDKAVGQCGQFIYGGCQGNGNRFSSQQECENICVTHEEARPNLTSTAICQLPADQGSCPEAYLKRWYFDNTRGECVAFIYTGCGGNFNNFKTFQSCLDFCKDFLPRTDSPAPVDEGLAPHECQAKFDECTTLRCPYGVEAYVDENDCNGCRCKDPCKDVECGEGTQCAIDLNRNKISNLDADFIAICRDSNKLGQCPALVQRGSTCEEECRNDADCALDLKCCSTGCGTSCVEPVKPPGELVTQQTYLPAFTDRPLEDIYRPPEIDIQIYKPEVSASLGDQAILNCAVSGNPNPKISWSKDNILIDNTHPRYRIKLDQTLQIITLHKTDSGIYVCTADNSIGQPIKNQIKLEVVDSGPRPATILNADDRELVSNELISLGTPAYINCYALGYPFPAVTWWKEDSLIPLKNKEFEVTRDNVLLIHSVQLHNLGVYTCQAYNGEGKAASWSITIKAKGPYVSTDPEHVRYLQYVVNPPEFQTTTLISKSSSSQPPPYKSVYRPTPQPYVPPAYPTEPSPDIIEPNEILPEFPAAAGNVQPPSYIVPVRVNITTRDQRYPTGGEIQLPCEVHGYPVPQVQWYKDGVPLFDSARVSISGDYSLTIRNAEKSDSGSYQCEATNSFSKSSSTLDILVEGMFIHPNCTDNQFFANCALIVKAKYCTHKYYAKFCCRSCTEAGLLAVDGPHLQESSNKQNSLDTNSL